LLVTIWSRKKASLKACLTKILTKIYYETVNGKN